MLCINTSKIKYSTVGASFTVTYSVAPEEIYLLMILHDKFAENNGKAYQISASDTEHTEREGE